MKFTFRHITFLLALMSFEYLGATSISGTCLKAKNQTVELSVYYNQFIDSPTFLTKTEIDDQGYFSIEAELPENSLIELNINGFKGIIYINSKSSYTLDLKPNNQQAYESMRPDKKLFIKLREDDGQGLNSNIAEVYRVLENFQASHYDYYLHGRVKEKLTLLTDSLYHIDTSLSFVKDFIHYTLGQQYLFAGEKEKVVFESYLSGDMNWLNPAYQLLFQDFYGKWFKRYVSKDERFRLYSAITKRSINGLDSLLAENDFLQDKEVRQCVMALEIYREIIDGGSFAKADLLALLSELYQNGYPEIQRLAASMLTRIKIIKSGFDAPELIADDLLGNRIKLSDFKGKYIYLDFWASWSEACLKQQPLIDSLERKFGDSVLFVSVNLDENASTELFKPNSENKRIALTPLDKEKVKADYLVFTIPMYYLIGPDGKILEAPARSPYEGVEYTFLRLFGKPGEAKNEIWDWNKHPGDKN